MDLVTILAAGGVLVLAIAVQLSLIVAWDRLRHRRGHDHEASMDAASTQGVGPVDRPDARALTDEEQLAELTRRFPPVGRRRRGRP